MALDLAPLSLSSPLADSTPPEPSTTSVTTSSSTLTTLEGSDILSLLDLFTNSLILDHIVRYLPLGEILALSQTSKSFRTVLFSTPSVFRYVDVSRSRGAWVLHRHWERFDRGGIRWRNERMDESLTEDDFYSGPLRGVLSKLRRLRVLANVQTLVVDKLASVTNDLVHELVASPDYNVRLLSIRGCLNLNETKLQQLLRHICRPSRPEGSPRLQGLYVFQPPPRPSQPDHAKDHNGAVRSEFGTRLQYAGGGVNEPKCSFDPGGDHCPWYGPSGQAIVTGHMQRSAWEETLVMCEGIVSFDAVLCTHMHRDMEPALHPASRDYLVDNKPGVPALATVALGPSGCAGCGRAPPGTPVWGETSPREFPLLWPPPWTGSLIDAVRPPPRFTPDGTGALPQRLIASCAWCLTNRYCEHCHRWWCKDCFNPAALSRTSRVASESGSGSEPERPQPELEPGHDTKDPRHMAIPKGKPAVTRDCYECGRLCGLCAPLPRRTCQRCKSVYCVDHNTGCDETTCDWCMFRGGQRGRDLY
ncbi:hypothetical protein RBB50_011931 [Rhinocladiella similis]